MVVPVFQTWRDSGRRGAEGSSVISGDVEILVSEQSGSAGTRQRIVELYDELRVPLHAYLSCLGMSLDQAEDIIQESFLRLVRHRFQQGSSDNLRAWLFRVAHNLSMDVHRFQRRWSSNSDEEPHVRERQSADPEPSPEQKVISKEHMKRFEDAFAQLTPKQRQCVLLRAEGFRYREIAHVLGISVQRVGELMQRSITLLEVRT
jgi:RNA polymerase sigma-70 factor, ECF subfamily